MQTANPAAPCISRPLCKNSRMILGAMSTENPFADPHLIWCEVGFAVADVQEVTQDVPGWGAVSAAVPDDLRKAVPKRRAEFLAGRFCAAVALRQLGLPESVPRQGRAPVWPDGVAGSITHSKDRAIAAVSRHHRCVGLDCEGYVADDRATQLSASIFTEAESRLRPDALPYGRFFTLVFSAKESLYKALSPRLTRVPNFHEVTLTDLAPGEMGLLFEGQPHRARFRLSGKDVLTLVVA